MGDDPYFPGLNSSVESRGGGSSASGGHNYQFHYGLSRGGSLFVVVAACMALGLSIGAVVITAVNAREASRAEREARMLQYYVLEMDAKLIAAGFKTDSESLARKLKETEK